MASKMLSPSLHLLTRPEDVHPPTSKVDSVLGQKGEGSDTKTATSAVLGAQKPEPTSNKTPAKDGSGKARLINIATTKSKTYNYIMSRQDNMNKMDPLNGKPVTKASNPNSASATAIEKSISNKLVRSWSISLSESHTNAGKSGINTAKSPQCPDLDALLVTSGGTTPSSPTLCASCVSFPTSTVSSVNRLVLISPVRVQSVRNLGLRLVPQTRKENSHKNHRVEMHQLPSIPKAIHCHESRIVVSVSD
ncbi:hypothetical protein HYALB_00008114 [Hymenoscyphus albidus]|uniref:Uncharacterized protein n=1 Tax=Hymenoscyphus albidus TaxID=595503 RepID=A0A9N9QCL1_9HELO|nr:hypothetical protein HYALB_00008114 [Hymenoscyphus albidus]